MHVHSTPIARFRSTSASNGPPKPDFPAGGSMPSHKLQMDTFGLEPTEACYVSTALVSGLSLLLLSTALRTFQYCNCLRMLAERCGSVRRAPISYAKKTASLRASVPVYLQSPPRRKIT